MMQAFGVPIRLIAVFALLEGSLLAAERAAQTSSKSAGVADEIEAAAAKAPPKHFSESDANLMKLDKIMEGWNLSERDLLEAQALAIRRGRGRLSWIYVLAEGRLNLLWAKQGLKIGSVEVAEKRILPIVEDMAWPEQMRFGYAIKIDSLLSKLWNSKEPIPDSLRRNYVQAMARVVEAGSDREYRQKAVEGCILFGGDVPEAAESVLRACKSPDEETRKSCIWRLHFGTIKFGVLQSKRGPDLLEEVKKILREPNQVGAEMVEKAVLSAEGLGQSLSGREREEFIELLGTLIRQGKTAKIRFRAYEALKGDISQDGIYRSASPSERERIDVLLKGYSPGPDRDAALGLKRRAK